MCEWRRQNDHHLAAAPANHPAAAPRNLPVPKHIHRSGPGCARLTTRGGVRRALSAPRSVISPFQG